MTDERKILVFFTNNLEQDCLFGYPEEYTEKAVEDWRNKLKEVDANIDTYDYDFIPVSKLPEKKYKAGIKGSKTGGIFVDDKKYLKNSNIQSQIIEDKKSKVAAELTKTDYKVLKYQEGQLSIVDYEAIKNIRKQLRDQYNELELKILGATTIKELERISNGN